MKPLLAIETSTVACSVAVGGAEGTALQERHEPGAHASHIMAMIDTALEDGGIEMNALGGIVYGQGPGSFTGVRIAVALAQGLAAGLSVPVLGVSSLAVLAQVAVAANPGRALLVVQDARMGEVYAGTYAPNVAGIVRATGADRLLEPDAVTALKDGVVLGGALQSMPALAARLEDCGMMTAPELMLPSARELLVLARAAGDTGWTPAANAAAVYLRQQVATAKPAG
ncbi:MAG: tRNA (adenosine(37)-N6)-threonylcarbamoyltransferase complex dimerization subunit type 1 TsaB [Pseudomonadota bacterium]